MQDVVIVHHKDFVGVVGQAVKAAQIAQHHFAGYIAAYAHNFKVHHRAHLAVFIRHGSLNLGAFLFIARLQHFVHHVRGQIVRQIRQIVGFHVFHRRHQLGFIHRFNQAFAHAVGYFQQHIAVFFGRGKFPHQHALFGRQTFQHSRHVSGVQFVQNAN